MCVCPEGIKNYSHEMKLLMLPFLSLYIILAVNIMNRCGLSSKACFDAVSTINFIRGSISRLILSNKTERVNDWAYTYIANGIKFG